MLYTRLFIGQNWDSEISWISKFAHRDHGRARYSPGPFSLWHHSLGSSFLCMPTQDTCGHSKPVSQSKNVSHFNEIKQNAVLWDQRWNEFLFKAKVNLNNCETPGGHFPMFKYTIFQHESWFPFSWIYLEQEIEMGTRGWFVPLGVIYLNDSSWKSRETWNNLVLPWPHTQSLLQQLRKCISSVVKNKLDSIINVGASLLFFFFF